MSKRSVSYIKPQEPSFLTKLKKEAGYVEGPDVNTKRQALEPNFDSDNEEREDESPVVVVLKDGDLTAEEVAKLQTDKEEEEANKPADLNKKIIFNSSSVSTKRNKQDRKNSDLKKPKTSDRKLLSFDQEEEEEF